MKFPGGIQTNFMPMLLVKFLGGSLIGPVSQKFSWEALAYLPSSLPSRLYPPKNRPATRRSGTGIRHNPVTVRRAAVLRNAVPGAATQHTVLTFFWTLRVGHVFFRVISVPVLAPLPDVAVHVMKPPGVGGKAADRRGLLPMTPFLAVAIDEIAVVIRLVRGNGFAKMEGRCRPGTTGKFPFRFGGQAIRFLVFFPQLLDKLLASSHETLSTGRFFSPLKRLGLLPMTSCHCSWVTVYTPM